ncbi:MAG: hypothetical protein GEV06_07165 [Luteitalea sp.]|nr:hypothetical protein [Luteitalea sp.]
MKQLSIGLPRHLFSFSVVVGLLVPFLARLPSVPTRGWEWFADYLPSVGGVLFLSAFNLIPAGALYGLGTLSKHAPLAFWFALSGGLAFLLWAHGTLNLRSSSTAGIALMFIPILATGAGAAGWVLGRLAHAIVKDDRRRAWMAGLAIVIAIAAGAGAGIYGSRSIAEREARFPVVAVKDVPLTKRGVHPCCPLGRVEVLALGNFDSKPGNDIAVLGTSGVALLSPLNYTVKFKAAFAHESCDGCVHMYPYLVADGKGGLLVASSAGVSDSRGRLLWALKATGFSRLVPIRVSPGDLTFFSYQSNDRADLHGPDGKVLWSIKLPVSDVGVYVAADGTRFPLAITGYGESRELRLYDNAGNPKRTIHLPQRTSEIESIAWPKPGHLLVGGGSRIGVLDPDGKEVLRHVIQGTSFNPYHGPDGTAVRFNTTDEPYLAVMSHGSSGYARSVLLLFDPKGRLVWQEEIDKVRTILAAPRSDGQGEVLLLGGMDGVVEYSLTRTPGKP